MAKKRAMLTPMNPPLAGTDATVLLSLAGLNNLARVKLEIHEGAFEHEGSGASDKTIGTMTGAALSFNDGVKRGMTIVLDASGGVMGDVPQPDADAKHRKRVIAFIIPKGSD